MTESIKEVEFVDELQCKFDRIYRGIARATPWISEGLGVYQCAYCEHSRDEATLPDEEHADDCLYVEGTEYMAKVYVDHLPKVIVINDSK